MDRDIRAVETFFAHHHHSLVGYSVSLRYIRIVKLRYLFSHIMVFRTATTAFQPTHSFMFTIAMIEASAPPCICSSSITSAKTLSNDETIVESSLLSPSIPASRASEAQVVNDSSSYTNLSVATIHPQHLFGHERA
ncbi:hypothetical protein SISSUDRAFT_1065215 [Sistotremastrum suecicum HHB10207 ss-3]|uniref:Uncharacterized protein n=1 Tax=Sistotremastrum suecicum HHB10207 ss-3 TaxID=1314776 RepID=A0A165ZRV7_9AGAM|nr:hypothetical protein SISSUDRAFT_1065215 [Sistotremastrum suecicum HHB10207 ss-3]